jgi:hypothetical protein
MSNWSLFNHNYNLIGADKPPVWPEDPGPDPEPTPAACTPYGCSNYTQYLGSIPGAYRFRPSAFGNPDGYEKYTIDQILYSGDGQTAFGPTVRIVVTGGGDDSQSMWQLDDPEADLLDSCADVLAGNNRYGLMPLSEDGLTYFGLAIATGTLTNTNPATYVSSGMTWQATTGFPPSRNGINITVDWSRQVPAVTGERYVDLAIDVEGGIVNALDVYRLSVNSPTRGNAPLFVGWKVTYADNGDTAVVIIDVYLGMGSVPAMTPEGLVYSNTFSLTPMIGEVPTNPDSVFPFIPGEGGFQDVFFASSMPLATWETLITYGNTNIASWVPGEECTDYARYECDSVEEFALQFGATHMPLTDPSTNATIPASLAGSGGEAYLYLEGTGNAVGRTWGEDTWGTASIIAKDYTPCSDTEIITYDAVWPIDNKIIHLSGQAYLEGMSLGVWIFGAPTAGISTWRQDINYDQLSNGAPVSILNRIRVKVQYGRVYIYIDGFASINYILPAVDPVEGYSVITHMEVVRKPQNEGANQLWVDITLNVYVNGLYLGDADRQLVYSDVDQSTISLTMNAEPTYYMNEEAPGGVIDLVVGPFFAPAALHNAYLRNRLSGI